MKKVVIQNLLVFTIFILSFLSTAAQDFEPMIYKGYAVDSTGTVLDGVFDIRLMVLDAKLEDRVLWSRIFLNVEIENGYYDINVADRTDEVRDLFGQGNDLLFRSVILDISYTIQQYLSVNFQSIALRENKIFAENYPVEDEETEIPELPFMPLRLICMLENIESIGDSRIQLKIINYDQDSEIIRIQFYKGYSDIKTYEFTLEGKQVWNETLSDFSPDLAKRKGYIEILSNAEKFLVSGEYIAESEDTAIVRRLNWIKPE